MASKEQEIIEAVRDLLQSASNSSTFTVSITPEAKFNKIFQIEALTTTQVVVSAAGREVSLAARGPYRKKEYTIVVSVLKKAAPDSVAWQECMTLAEEIDDYISSYTGNVAGTTWTASSATPVFDPDAAESMNTFRSITQHTFTYTVAPRNWS